MYHFARGYKCKTHIRVVSKNWWGGVGHCAVDEDKDDEHSAIRQGSSSYNHDNSDVGSGSGAEDNYDSSTDNTGNSAVGSGLGAEGDDDSSSDDTDNSAVRSGAVSEDNDEC